MDENRLLEDRAAARTMRSARRYGPKMRRAAAANLTRSQRTTRWNSREHFDAMMDKAYQLAAVGRGLRHQWRVQRRQRFPISAPR